ncbi:MAG: nitrilase, partial [Desulfobacterales bacterium]|nr:nitrilase [Desulfobacterales bacterium]
QKFNSWMRHLPARAFDNGLYVVACNQTGDNQNGLNFPGLSVIFNPSGQIIKKDTSGKEKIIIADLKAEGLAKVRDHRMRYFLPNRRPGLYYHEK